MISTDSNTHIDNILVRTKNDFADHLKAPEKVLQKLAEV